MIKTYPNYSRGKLLLNDSKESLFSEFPEKDKKAIGDFIKYVGMQGITERKKGDMARSIIQFRHIIGKEFSNIKLRDLQDFLTLLNGSNREKYTKNGIKTHIKRFLKWKFKEWSKRFDELKDIKIQNGFNNKKINASVLLTKEEIEKIMQTEVNPFWKAVFITLYESAMRPIELQNLKWQDITFNTDGDISELRVYSEKNETHRTLFVKQATPYLKKLKEKRNSEWVFPTSYRSDGKLMDKPIKKSTISLWLQRLCIIAIGRHIHPYILRHTRATELYLNAKIPDKVAQKFLGHGKNMSDSYAHLSPDDVKEAMTSIVYKTEDLPEEKKHELEEKVETLERDKNENEQKIQELKSEVSKISKSTKEAYKLLYEIQMAIYEPQRLKKHMKKIEKHYEGMTDKEIEDDNLSHLLWLKENIKKYDKNPEKPLKTIQN